jgi:hypothetical protein
MAQAFRALPVCGREGPWEPSLRPHTALFQSVKVSCSRTPIACQFGPRALANGDRRAINMRGGQARDALNGGATGYSQWTMGQVMGHAGSGMPLEMTMGVYAGKAGMEAKAACVRAVKLPT